MKIKKFDQINEGVNSNPINLDKLKEYAKGIGVCCAGEYGDVYYNEGQNHVFVCLGDSHPFDEEYLESFAFYSQSGSTIYVHKLRQIQFISNIAS